MKRLEQALFASVVTGSLGACFAMGCQLTPKLVGQAGASGGNAGGGSSAGASGGTTGPRSSGSGNADQGGSAGRPIIVLPDDAALVRADVVDDSASAPATGDANCGSTQSKLVKKPADILLVLDRSSSMGEAMDSSRNCATGSTTCSQRWATIISSLAKVLTSSSGDINWGLKFFSSPTGGGAAGPGAGGGNCTVSAGADVAVGPGNADTIQTQINAIANGGYTPTRAAIDAAVAYLKTVSDGNNKVILLATDGEPNCPAGQGSSSTTSDLTATTTAVTNAAAAGFKVYVIGVGTETGNLTSLAQAGGTDKFYSALTPDDLSTALSSIVGTVAAGCTYTLPSTPVTPNAVGVYVDKTLIPQSDSDGWSYAPGTTTTIDIHGSICDDLTAGKKTLVEIFLPCQESEPIPTVIP